MQASIPFRILQIALIFASVISMNSRAEAEEPNIPPAIANQENVTPDAFLGEKPSSRQRAALVYLTSRSFDEVLFIKQFKTQDSITPESKDDEFSVHKANANNSEEEANRAALAWAHEVLDGKRDLPVKLSLSLFKYNPENQSFITEITSPELYYDVHGYPSLGIGHYTLPGIKSIIIYRLDIFESIIMSPEHAKALTLELDQHKIERRIMVFAKIRLRANSLTKIDGSLMYQADIREYKLGFNETTNSDAANVLLLNERYGHMLNAAPYQRTASESDFIATMKDRVWFGISRGCAFREKGICYIFALNLTEEMYSGENKGHLRMKRLADTHASHWYIINGKLFVPYGYNYETGQSSDLWDLWEYSVVGDLLRLDGVPFAENTEIHFDGDSIIFKEKPKNSNVPKTRIN